MGLTSSQPCREPSPESAPSATSRESTERDVHDGWEDADTNISRQFVPEEQVTRLKKPHATMQRHTARNRRSGRFTKPIPEPDHYQAHSQSQPTPRSHKYSSKDLSATIIDGASTIPRPNTGRTRLQKRRSEGATMPDDMHITDSHLSHASPPRIALPPSPSTSHDSEHIYDNITVTRRNTRAMVARSRMTLTKTGVQPQVSDATVRSASREVSLEESWSRTSEVGDLPHANSTRATSEDEMGTTLHSKEVFVEHAEQDTAHRGSQDDELSLAENEGGVAEALAAVETLLRTACDLNYPPDLRERGDYSRDEVELIRRALRDFQEMKCLDTAQLIDVIQDTSDDMESRQDVDELWSMVEAACKFRGPAQVKRYVRSIYHTYKTGDWAEDEDIELLEHFEKTRHIWWQVAATAMNRSQQDITSRLTYLTHLRSKKVKDTFLNSLNKWPPYEEDLLVQAVSAAAQKEEDRRYAAGLPALTNVTTSDIDWMTVAQYMAEHMNTARSHVHYQAKWTDMKSREEEPLPIKIDTRKRWAAPVEPLFQPDRPLEEALPDVLIDDAEPLQLEEPASYRDLETSAVVQELDREVRSTSPRPDIRHTQVAMQVQPRDPTLQDALEVVGDFFDCRDDEIHDPGERSDEVTNETNLNNVSIPLTEQPKQIEEGDISLDFIESTHEVEIQVRRKRGRPRKSNVSASGGLSEVDTPMEPSDAPPATSKRGRGRPRKSLPHISPSISSPTKAPGDFDSVAAASTHAVGCH